MSKKVLSITTVAVIVIVAISGAYFYHKSQYKTVFIIMIKQELRFFLKTVVTKII